MTHFSIKLEINFRIEVRLNVTTGEHRGQDVSAWVGPDRSSGIEYARDLASQVGRFGGRAMNLLSGIGWPEHVLPSGARWLVSPAVYRTMQLTPDIGFQLFGVTVESDGKLSDIDLILAVPA